MSKKWKILGIQTDVEWYDVKTKLKYLLRRITYSFLAQHSIAWLIKFYILLVYHSSKKIFINHDFFMASAKNPRPLLLSCWHNRIMLSPFITVMPKKLYPNYHVMALTSRHGDGRFVGLVAQKFGLMAIFGSTRDGRKSSRGIDVSSLKKLFSGLKKGYSLGITPDGPRGPNQQINGEIVNIAKISGAGILPFSYASSRFKQLNTWDKFKIPLPFSTLCFCFDENLITLEKNADENALKAAQELTTERMNLMQETADKAVGNRT
jgi:lysophospholipid acyltransferase (LPLAT)-like uncharacterized protein